jgi:hypothetical protein
LFFFISNSAPSFPLSIWSVNAPTFFGVVIAQEVKWQPNDPSCYHC